MNTLPSKFICLLIFYSFLSTVSFSKDGLWNGKPTPRKTLEAGVAKGDPDALAEWADCSRNGTNDIKYNLDETIKYATLADKKGNAYGAAILARCYIIGAGVPKNEKLGAQFATKAAKAGHPLGIKELAHCYREGTGGYVVNMKKHAELLNKSADLGCMMARLNRVFCLTNGINGFPRNSQKALQELAQIVDIYPYSSIPNNYLYHMQRSSKTHPTFSVKRYENAYSAMKKSAELGNQKVETQLGQTLISDGKPELGVPYILNAARSPHKYSSRIAFLIAFRETGGSRAKSRAEYKTIFRLARDAYDAGSRNKLVIGKVAESYITGMIDKKYSIEKSWPYITQLLKTDYYAAETLAGLYFAKKKNPKHNYDLARAYYILSISNDHDVHDAARFMAQSYWDLRKGDDDSEAYAIAHYALKIQTKAFRKTVEALQERILKRISKEDRLRGDLLIKENYPMNDKTIESAKKLIESHHLPTRIVK